MVAVYVSSHFAPPYYSATHSSLFSSNTLENPSGYGRPLQNSCTPSPKCSSYPCGPPRSRSASTTTLRLRWVAPRRAQPCGGTASSARRIYLRMRGPSGMYFATTRSRSSASSLPASCSTALICSSAFSGSLRRSSTTGTVVRHSSNHRRRLQWTLSSPVWSLSLSTFLLLLDCGANCFPRLSLYCTPFFPSCLHLVRVDSIRFDSVRYPLRFHPACVPVYM